MQHYRNKLWFHYQNNSIHHLTILLIHILTTYSFKDIHTRNISHFHHIAQWVKTAFHPSLFTSKYTHLYKSVSHTDLGRLIGSLDSLEVPISLPRSTLLGLNSRIICQPKNNDHHYYLTSRGSHSKIKIWQNNS